MPHAEVKKIICVLDDDPMVEPIIRKSTGYETTYYSDPEKLVEDAVNYTPTAAFIDIHLGYGRKSGIDIIPILKEYWKYIPIIVITGDEDPNAISQSLASGADDFIKKPIKPEEAAARLKVRLENSAQIEAKELIKAGDIEIDINHRSLEGPKGKRFISPTEVKMLVTLVKSQGSVIDKDSLKTKCWGQVAVSDNALHRKLHAVRQAVSDVSESVTIKSIYGVGFSLRI